MKHAKRYDRLCLLLRSIREEAGLFQAELADRLGKPQTYVSKVELGERSIDFIETLDFCQACGVTPKKFVERFKQEDASPSQPERHRKRRRPPRSKEP